MMENKYYKSWKIIDHLILPLYLVRAESETRQLDSQDAKGGGKIK